MQHLKEREATEEKEKLKRIQDATEAERVTMLPFTEKAEQLAAQLKSTLIPMITTELKKISKHKTTCLEKFVVGGSWASAKIAEALCIVFHDNESFAPVSLHANDIDVYHEKLTDDNTKELGVQFS
mmetsp:Transcript_39423/g.67186  ORF Transcript_39423/g.67186 Transcript_39423/m.67186 type:complete len:126 (-) Transcript_39423:3-380(-)